MDGESKTTGLVIKEVTGGAASLLPLGSFKPMDRIVAVNGREGSNEQMLDMIAKQPSPTLRLHPGSC